MSTKNTKQTTIISVWVLTLNLDEGALQVNLR